ncbi:T9SS type B sorting domain-containing protein [uncultured Tenacibaculum sp.]|uniref:T9SS type B sorting domain-containing protein n=1 Tax=uncultured Tenacibaculum sp. TaxID=174713 RepID=UPI00261E06BF|nr:T9SS type B sorting domain-containing protein [uncultured Tenacibaculum sp.]
MRQLLLLICIIFLNATPIFSQKEANFWYFGQNAALDFNSGVPVPVSGSQLNTFEGCSSFSDSNGNLLFYVGAPSPNARNLTIWNSSNQPMPFTDPAVGGQTLKGDSSSSQSALTVPAPKKPNIYYLFTVGATVGAGGEFGFWYYTIDMTEDSGKGDIVDGPVSLHTPLLKDQWTEKVTAVRASTCNTFWVISFASNGDFYAYKVDENGVDTANPVVSSLGGLFINDPRGYLKVSPDGKKLVLANMTSGAYLFDFDDTSGRVSHFGGASTPQQINVNSESAYGAEFSITSQKLYVSTGEWTFGTTENLYQFDVTKNSITEVNNSRYTVHSYLNTRGALQLGPDRKIYWSSDRNSRISVINNPDETGAACNYSHQSVDLGGRLATQGLPPFLSSLLLPIEIKDQITSTIVNDQTLQHCVGDSKTIAPDPVTGTNVVYEWTFDNGTTTNTVSNTINLNINNMTMANAGTYQLKVTRVDTCGNIIEQQAKFNLEIYQATSATQPSNIFFCDVDNDGFNSFNLQNDVTPQVLNGLDPAIFEVVYYIDATDANNNNTANALSNPYTNPTAFSNQTIYARMHNTSAPNACYDIKTFTLAVTGKPTPQTPINYEVCDDTASGSDTDGFYNSFNLSTKDNEILGSLNPTTYQVSYHTSLTGAQTSSTTDVIDKNAPYRNATVNSQTIYVRVENNTNVACNDSSVSFDLVVNALPVIANNPTTIRHCDVDFDTNANINLTLSQQNISTNHLNESFKYYPTENDAIMDTSEITNQTAHPLSNGDTVWVRTISNKNCYRISRINIVIGHSANVAYSNQFRQCDDFLDADGNNNASNNDTDGITTFDISSVVTDVKALFPASLRPNLDVLIFENLADRDAVLNAIPDLANYRNKNVPAATPQPLYIKIISTINNDCTGLGEFTIWAQQPPTANTVPNFEFCDDFNSGAFDDGINVNINLRDRVSAILGPTQAMADYTVTFHTSATDANTGNNPIPNDTSYTNQTRDRETVYVRVVNNSTGCFNDHLTFDIIINPLPVISKAITDLEVCDVATASDGDPRNGLAQNIDLSQRDSEILDGRNPSDFTITYHRTLQNAIDGVLPFPDKTNYSNEPTTTIIPAPGSGDAPARERIYVSLYDRNTQCRYGLATLDIIIHPEPSLPVNITNYEDCDNNSDTNQDDTNGINGDITLNSKNSEILANYTPAERSNFKVTFHTSLADAQSGNAPIDENKYENTNNNQTIYVRVQNIKTSCVNDNLSFNIVINPLPSFTVTTPVIVCLNNPQTRLEALNPGATYDYKWYIKGNPTNILSTDPFYDVQTAGTYVVTATMRNPTACERSEIIQVDPSTAPVFDADDVVIVDDTNNNRLDNYSITIITENNNLGIGDYEFSLIDEKNNQTLFQDEPVFNNLIGGIYTIVIRDKNGCQPNARLDVSVIEYPKFLTPNGDGQNDTWKIKGANSSFYPSSSIHVFDRFGKIVAVLPIDHTGWDGTYNGNVLPSSDYWFKIQLVDRKGKVYQHQGHFSLLRK